MFFYLMSSVYIAEVILKIQDHTRENDASLTRHIYYQKRDTYMNNAT